MNIAVVILVAGARPSPDSLESALVTDILWTAAGPEDGLEHIHSRTSPERIELTMFYRSTAAAAAAAAERACRNALRSSPTLRGWRFVSD